MLIYPYMLTDAATQAGMKVPDDPENFDKGVYPHFFVFCNVQLNRPVEHGEHWENAKVIAKIPDEQITKVTVQDLIDLGLSHP